jgi:hypothetical protein
MHRFKDSSTLGQFIKLDSSRAHCADHLMRILRAVISVRSHHDPMNAAIIICSASLENALQRKLFHINKLRPLLMSHLIRLPEPSTNSHPDATYVFSQKANVSNTDT